MSSGVTGRRRGGIGEQAVRQTDYGFCLSLSSWLNPEKAVSIQLSALQAPSEQLKSGEEAFAMGWRPGRVSTQFYLLEKRSDLRSL